MNLTHRMAATLDGIRNAESKGAPLLKTQVSRRFRDALLRRDLVEIVGAELHTTTEGRWALVGYNLGKQRRPYLA